MTDKKTERRQGRAERKILKSRTKSPKRQAKVQKKYGYNIEGAKAAGLSPDASGHWPSRDPMTGEIFKGRKHPTIHKTKKVERQLGYKITRKKGTLYSNPKR